jgi:hypothetical protein
MPTLVNPVYAPRPLQMSDPDDSTGAPEYNFDGYSVEFSQKIALTPIVPRHPHRTKPADAR